MSGGDVLPEIDPDWKPVTETALICPYCMNEVSSETLGCCGESSAHFVKVDRAKWEAGDDDLELEY